MPVDNPVVDSGSGSSGSAGPVLAISGPVQAPHPTSTASVVYPSGSEGPAMVSLDIQARSGSTSVLSGAHHTNIGGNLNVTEIHGNVTEIHRNITEIHGNVTEIHEDKVYQIMELILKYILAGAAHDDSSRQYPPRCHPGTREAILEILRTWFNDIFRSNSLFLISGPAGVGKSAIMQTFAESIDDRVISVFISRPNDRNDPTRIFITFAYQLAKRIKPYRDYIVDLIATNRDILTKNMETQFRAFITEPFGVRKIGAGGPPMAILLDGLDEVDGVEPQRDIIRIIGKFTQEYRDTPLAWIIASRPEFHITNTFKEPSIQDRFESQPIFIDAPEAREDVRHFLVDSFNTIRDESFGPVPVDWPGEARLAKLTAASSGLFIFAETAARFVKDPGRSNPVSRLEIVLAVIDRSNGVAPVEQPFKILDNLYAAILSQVSPAVLTTTKLLLGLALSFRSGTFLGLGPRSKSRTLKGMSMILQLELHDVYSALINCISTLKIPPWEEAHESPLTFLHASFPDYLTDAKRSGEFCIDVDGVDDDVVLGYLAMWYRHFGDNAAPLSESFHDNMWGTPEFTTGMLRDMSQTLLYQIVERHKPRPVFSEGSQQKHVESFNSLRNINMIRLCKSGDGPLTLRNAPLMLFRFVHLAFQTWMKYQHVPMKSGMFSEALLEDIYIDYQDNETRMVILPVDDVDLLVPHDLDLLFKLDVIDDETKKFLNASPKLPVLICGAAPNGQIAFFLGNKNKRCYCIAPYYYQTKQDGMNHPIERKRDKFKGLWKDLIKQQKGT